MKVLIATKNQGKIEGAKRALEKYFDNITVEGIPADSEVGEQPVNNEIYEGAKNRVKNLKKYCKENNIKADLFLSIESGINNLLGRWMITNIAVTEDNENFESYGTSPSFPVPERLVNDIISTDLSKVIDKIFEKDEERHNKGGGFILESECGKIKVNAGSGLKDKAGVKSPNTSSNVLALVLSSRKRIAIGRNNLT